MPMRSLADVLRNHRVVLCGGSGGVGKTTTAAALGIMGAGLGRNTLILTIDPARRLANAMGLTHIDKQPQPMQPESFAFRVRSRVICSSMSARIDCPSLSQSLLVGVRESGSDAKAWRICVKL